MGVASDFMEKKFPHYVYNVVAEVDEIDIDEDYLPELYNGEVL